MLAIQKVLVDEALVNRIYEEREVEYKLPTGVEVPPVNGYALMVNIYNEKHTVIAQHLGNFRWRRIRPDKYLNINSYAPRDAHQSALMDCMKNEDILINVAFGSAGTGKTTLALATAVERFNLDGRKILLSKPTATVGAGRAFGPVPGTIEEKYEPYLASYRIVFEKVLPDKTYVDRMIAKGDIEFIPVELARGCTFDNATFILDEAQNLSWHEMNTIISRMGENTKMIILGDLKQIDVPMKKHETGLYKLINSMPFKNSEITSAIELQNQYRSPITALVAEVSEWLAAQEDDE